MMPLNDDALVHVAPAGSHDVVPYDEFEVYRIPMGTIVAIRPGVWHHAPFCMGNTPLNSLVVLPERCYATDCVVVTFPEEELVQIIL